MRLKNILDEMKLTLEGIGYTVESERVSEEVLKRTQFPLVMIKSIDKEYKEIESSAHYGNTTNIVYNFKLAVFISNSTNNIDSLEENENKIISALKDLYKFDGGSQYVNLRGTFLLTGSTLSNDVKTNEIGSSSQCVITFSLQTLKAWN